MSLNTHDVTRIQTALGSQQAGNDLVGMVMFRGGFAVNGSGAVIAGSSTGPFTFVPDSSGTVGAYRAYPNMPAGTIVSIDNISVGGFTPRGPSVSETTIAQVTGFGIDAATGTNYITIQQATFSGALQGSLPTKFVIGVSCSLTLSANANPL
jgi:hypothetical protein